MSVTLVVWSSMQFGTTTRDVLAKRSIRIGMHKYIQGVWSVSHYSRMASFQCNKKPVTKVKVGLKPLYPVPFGWMHLDQILNFPFIFLCWKRIRILLIYICMWVWHHKMTPNHHRFMFITQGCSTLYYSASKIITVMLGKDQKSYCVL